MKKEKVAVSACLVGENCKYNGKNNKNEKVLEFIKDKDYITICPESYGGLPTPRVPSEIEEGFDGKDIVENMIFLKDKEINVHVYSKKGVDVTLEFIDGAKKALEKIQSHGAKIVILKESSPSCGVNTIYTGRFDGTKKNGSGVSAALFKESGITVISEKDL